MPKNVVIGDSRLAWLMFVPACSGGCCTVWFLYIFVEGNCYVVVCLVLIFALTHLSFALCLSVFFVLVWGGNAPALLKTALCM